MKVTLTIDCDNAAFADDQGGGEVARILRIAAQRLEEVSYDAVEGFALRDINGNVVGRCEVIQD